MPKLSPSSATSSKGECAARSGLVSSVTAYRSTHSMLTSDGPAPPTRPSVATRVRRPLACKRNTTSAVSGSIDASPGSPRSETCPIVGGLRLLWKTVERLLELLGERHPVVRRCHLAHLGRGVLEDVTGVHVDPHRRHLQHGRAVLVVDPGRGEDGLARAD